MTMQQFLHNHTDRFVYTVVFGLLFVLFGTQIPQFYFKYLDQTEYVKFTTLITFDKLQYHVCEKQNALSNILIRVSSPTEIHSRLYLTLKSSTNTYQIIKEFDTRSFLQEQSRPQSLWTSIILPCDLRPGTYFYQGILTYQFHDIQKTADFVSQPFTIVK